MDKKDNGPSIGVLNFMATAAFVSAICLQTKTINERNETIDRLLSEKSEAKTELIEKKSDAKHSKQMSKLDRLLFFKDAKYDYGFKPDGSVDSTTSTVTVPLNNTNYLK